MNTSIRCGIFSVPIKGVAMTTPTNYTLTIMENHSATFECLKIGLPAADIRWFRACGGSETFLVGSTETTAASDNLQIITSCLVYKTSAADNGCRIYCKANNTKIDFSSAVKPQLNVQCKFCYSLFLKQNLVNLYKKLN